MKIRDIPSALWCRLRNFDTNSLRFKLWAYFFLFAICLMAALWLLQTILLQPYYQNMKEKEITRIAHSISAEYSQSQELDVDAFVVNTLAETAISSDMRFYFQVSGSRGQFISPELITSSSSGRFPDVLKSMETIKGMVSRSPSGTIPVISQNDMMMYGTMISSKYRPDAILCISTPLTPVESTINILASQLIMVTAASLILACVLSLWIAQRVTAPIFAITKKANQLAIGQYGITFDGGHYSEIQDLANTLTYTSAELAKSDNLHKDLLANVSHDLRTPLTMVKSYAEMIRDLSGDNPQKRNAHLQVIIEEADRLNRLVSDMLLLSKMQSGVEAMHVDSFDLKESIVSLMNTYLILEEQDGYHFEFVCDEESVAVLGDESRLKQVITNLLNNAVRYGGDARAITIDLSIVAADRKNRFARVAVCDKGPGIPAEELGHIWDRYYKVSRTGTRAVSGGTGLGLSIVKEILVLHKARFGVDSKVEEGSTFWFELPL